METSVRSNRTSGLMLPLLAATCSIIAVLLLVSAGFGSRFGLWHFRTGFAIQKFAAYFGLACSVLALVSGAVSLKKRQVAGAVLSLVALLIGIFTFGVPYSWKLKAQRYPRIHDISTDLDNPPKFVAVVPLRQGVVEYSGAAVAAQQLKAYPDLKTLVLNVPMERAFQSALETAREMGWQIVAQVPAEGRIEATDTTFWYGFKDDIVIRVYPAAAGDRSLVDIRSVSRVGVSDVGTNAKRIRSFLAKISHQPQAK
jgi:uncharacterized protein (DUF1499 family)